MPQQKQSKNKTKYLFISGGVISGLGKGIITASVSLLLKAHGYKVSPVKADMYLNIDAGTMNPLEHGETFVTEDGLETDQDLGHYERFLNKSLTAENYMTMGQIYSEVLRKERALEYQGKCVEGNIHVPEEITKRILKMGKENDIVLIEVGGTVGEYQNVMFFEVIRRLKQKLPKDVALVHVVYLPIPPFLGEMKSKPAQNSVYDLYQLGVSPDFIIARAQVEIDSKRKKTLAFNTGIPEDHIIASPDVNSVYKIPLILKSQHLDIKILNLFNLSHRQKLNELSSWQKQVLRLDNPIKEIKIAIAGKYFVSGSFQLEDSYVCVLESVKHACWKLGFKPVIKWFDVERFEKVSEKEALKKELAGFDGIIVPQGWGSRGVEGKIEAVKFARERKIPYLGLCFGMQMAVIEFARNVLGLKGANTEEADINTKYPVIHIMNSQKELVKNKKYGGTIRKGAWPCKLKKDSIIEAAYKTYSKDRVSNDIVQERHRHRYEFNNEFKELFEKHGFNISGFSPDGSLVEAIELSKSIHPFFVGTQFHPEYKSRFLDPHPIFVSFIKASSERSYLSDWVKINKPLYKKTKSIVKNKVVYKA